ncbi:MAG: hypothetical protein CO113_16200 [Elusimicrobia bacterium CG_4_9_14_3_um_filter_62_55]|nr:MAG: hypothetical protein CO113_16200 [Elusimicrobia bacterium CG_4_9_14_3_um_filter_62_55]
MRKRRPAIARFIAGECAAGAGRYGFTRRNAGGVRVTHLCMRCDPKPVCASTEFFALGPDGLSHGVRDGVCGRIVPIEQAVHREAANGTRCYFCSRACLMRYYLNPLNFLRKK